MIKRFTFSPDVPAGDRERLLQELVRYEEKNSLTAAEKRALRRWVGAGHSVCENGGSRYVCIYGAFPPLDFMDVYRMDRDIAKRLKGKKGAERRNSIMEYMGCTDYEEKQELTPQELRRRLEQAEGENEELLSFIRSKHLAAEAEGYLEQCRRTESLLPFPDHGC